MREKIRVCIDRALRETIMTRRPRLTADFILLHDFYFRECFYKILFTFHGQCACHVNVSARIGLRFLWPRAIKLSSASLVDELGSEFEINSK